MLKSLWMLLSLLNSPTELDCLAKNVYFESRNQSISGQYAVAEVTLNRVEASYWPNSVCGVVKQKNQFTWFWDGKSDKPKDKKAWKIAQQVAINSITRPTNITGGATFYHANYVSPKWAKTYTRTITIDKHEFYKI